MRDLRSYKSRRRTAGTNPGAARVGRRRRLPAGSVADTPDLSEVESAEEASDRAACPRERRGVPWFVVVPAILAVLLAAGAAAGLRLNVTESLPVGLYRASEFDPETAAYGELVTFCPRRGALTAVAPYLLAGDDCVGENEHAQYAELAKAVAGLPGDTVTVSARGVRVNRVPLPHSAPLAYSRSGAPVAAALGPHVLGPSEYWMHSGRVRYSLDSRYYGPVTDVRRRLESVLTSGGPQALDQGWCPSRAKQGR